jgi:hypothetical protein
VSKVYPWIVVTLLVAMTGSTLALMNNACKVSPHAWCNRDSQHHISRRV